MSAVLSLVLPDGARDRPFLAQIGYRLNLLELPMVDATGRSFRLDLHVVRDDLNLSLLVDCKSSPDTLKMDQIASYFATTGREVVISARLTSTNPRAHRADAVFFILPGVEGALAAMVAACQPKLTSGWGMIRFAATRIEAAHDEFSDADLSTSLAQGWEVQLARMPLERLPFEPDSPDWDLADALFRTLTRFFLSGPREFGVEELCSASNELWPYLREHHDFIGHRVRRHMRAIRGTALKGWITKVNTPSGREERWKFARRSTTNRNVIGAIARRHQRYVSVLLNNRDPLPADFIGIDAEQLGLPFSGDEGSAG